MEMKICRFKDPRRFQDRIQDYLIEHEAENNLPLGILNNVISGEYNHQDPYLAYVEQDGKPAIASLCTPPFPAILSYQDPAPDDAAIGLLLDDLTAFLGDRFAGISGEKALASRMKDLWQDRTGGKAKLHMAMRIYRLNEVIPARGVPGDLRPAGEDDRKLMQDWYAGFQREAVREEPDPEKVQDQVNIYLEADQKVRGLYFWEKDGQPVSMAGYAGPTPSGIRVGAVYTPPEQRKQGFASAVTAGVSQHLLDAGYKFVFLFTDLMNPTSNHIYQQIGFQAVCDVDRYDFG
jgi:hypothetical protein